MRFQLLSKKGNKHQAHALALPSDSMIATKTREWQSKELAERKQLKERRATEPWVPVARSAKVPPLPPALPAMKR